MLISRMKETMQDMKERFSGMPTSSHVVVIDGIHKEKVKAQRQIRYADSIR